MVGKIRGLPPDSGQVKIRGIARTYYSNRFQRWVTASWPVRKAPVTPAEAVMRKTFSQVVKAIKSACPEDATAALALSANTPYLPRDLLYKSATGTLLEFLDSNGRLWMSTRTAIQTVQPLLDSVSHIPGAMLVRGPDYWLAIQGDSTKNALQWNDDTGQPEWISNADLLDKLTAIWGGAIGDIPIFDAGGNITPLAAGTADFVLTSNGAGAAPSWKAAAGGGGGDAHPGMRSGQWYTSPGMNAITSNLLSSGHLYAVPFYVPKSYTFDAVGIRCVSAVASSALRIGIYANADGLPTTLIQDFGAIATTTTGFKSITGLTLNLPEGWYWLVCNSNSTQQISVYTAPQYGTFTGWDTAAPDLSIPGKGIVTVQAYGAMPANFPAVAYASPGTWPVILLQRS